jgi:hypothetical protein
MLGVGRPTGAISDADPRRAGAGGRRPSGGGGSPGRRPSASIIPSGAPRTPEGSPVRSRSEDPKQGESLGYRMRTAVGDRSARPRVYEGSPTRSRPRRRSGGASERGSRSASAPRRTTTFRRRKATAPRPFGFSRASVIRLRPRLVLPKSDAPRPFEVGRGSAFRRRYPSTLPPATRPGRPWDDAIEPNGSVIKLDLAQVLALDNIEPNGSVDFL